MWKFLIKDNLILIVHSDACSLCFYKSNNKKNISSNNLIKRLLINRHKKELFTNKMLFELKYYCYSRAYIKQKTSAKFNVIGACNL